MAPAVAAAAPCNQKALQLGRLPCSLRVATSPVSTAWVQERRHALPHKPHVRAGFRGPTALRAASTLEPQGTLVPSISSEDSIPPAPYTWTSNWWPVSPISYLDPSRPNTITLLGQQLVLWKHAQDGWVALEDRCPHRLAPLSEGRLEGGNTRLMCSYHGWQFDGKGACTNIPQLVSDSKASATALASKRSCATHYPTHEKGGLLFVWLDPNPEGLAKAAASEPYVPPAVAYTTPGGGGTSFDWGMNEVPNDFVCWMEQPMDPSHANFLHHGLAPFTKENAIPFEGDAVPPADIDLHKGFVWQHGGYETKNKGMKATREFHPPCTFRVQYDYASGMTSEYCTIVLPVRPGWCRTYFKFGSIRPTNPPPAAEPAAASHDGKAANGNGAQQQHDAKEEAAPKQAQQQPQQKKKKKKKGGFSVAGLLFSLTSKLPHYVPNFHPLTDQDVVIMAKQYRIMCHDGRAASDYSLMANSDAGIVAIHRWLKLAGYPNSLWGRHTAGLLSRREGAGANGSQSAGAPVPAEVEEVSLERMLSRYERHVKNCLTCQKGLRLWTNVAIGLTVAAGLAAAVAVAALYNAAAAAAAGAAGGLPWGAALAVGLAAGLAWAALWAWEGRTGRFISGLPAWTRKGGYALVPRA